MAWQRAETSETGPALTSTNKLDYVDTAANTYTRRVNTGLDVITLDHEGSPN